MRTSSSRTRARRWVFGVLLLNFALFGITAVMLGATVPRVMRDLQWGYVETGCVLSASSVGYLVSTFLSGLFLGRAGPRRALAVGLALQAAGLGLFGRWPGVGVNVALTFLMGVGHGLVEVATNVCVVGMERARESRLMNLMHAAFPVGAIAGPLLVAWLLGLGRSWPPLYRGLAALNVAGAALVLASPFSELAAGRPPPLRAGALRGLVTRPRFLFLASAITFYVACEVGISSWIAEYFVVAHRFSPAASARAVAVFWSGILLGRLGASFGDRALRRWCGAPERLLAAFAALQSAGLLAAVTAGRAAAAEALFFVCGLGCSAVYPLTMRLVGSSVPQELGIAVGLTASGGGLGAMLAPFLMSWIGARSGIGAGFWLCVGFALLTLVSVLAAAVRGRAPRTPAPEAAAPGPIHE